MIGLLFSGQGAQTVGMGASLHEHSPAARALYDRADAVLGWSVRDVSFNGPQEKLTETRVCQPALYVHGLAVVAALQEAGKLPEAGAALGLSLGELTALSFAAAFDFETGLRTVAERGRLMQEACDATNGTMAAVIGGTVDDVRELAAAHGIDVANLNCPGQTVISGERAKVLAAADAAKASGKFRLVKPLDVAGAYHSRLMESARQRFAAFLETVDIREPRIPVFTNTSGGQVKSPAEIRAALARQVVSSVLWEDCMRSAQAMGVSDFFECGPDAALAGMAKRIDRALTVRSFSKWEDVSPRSDPRS